MAIIQSGATTDLWTIDPTSNAGRVTLYDSAGLETGKPPTGAFLAGINIRQAAATAAPATVWAMRNVSGPATAYIRHIRLIVSFDGTASAGNTLRYDLQRFDTATPTGGTAVTVVKKRSAYAASNVSDVRFADAGLTTTGVVFGATFHTVGVPVSVTNQCTEQDLDFSTSGERYNAPFELASGEGLCIRLNVAAIIGLTIRGSISWDEK